jgi:hemolysin activation/secretion protein
MNSLAMPKSQLVHDGSKVLAWITLVSAGILLFEATALKQAHAKTNEVAPKPDPAGVTLTLATHSPVKTPRAGCSRIRRLEVRGILSIDVNTFKERLEPLALNCVGNDEIKAILTAINEIYSDKGYVATQGYLPEQDLQASEILGVNVIAGRVDSIIYRENRGDEALPMTERWGKAWSKVRESRGPWNSITALSQLFDRLDDPLDSFQLLPRDLKTDPKVWTSFIVDSGEVVQIDAIQQGVDQINRVASGHSQVKLEPGDGPATSKVVVENNQEDSFRVNAGYELNGADINGSGNTVPNRFKIDAAKDNLIGVNDAWRLSYAGGLDSNEVRGAFSMPFRRATFSFDGGYSESLSEVASGVEMFSRDGTISTSLGYMLYRSRDRQINLDTSLYWRNNERFINGASLTPQTVTHARIGIAETRTFDTVQLNYGLGVDHGLPILGALSDPADASRSSPRAEFFKLDGQASLAKVLSEIGTMRVELTGQWTNRPLYSDDQLVLGSISTVRGFTNGSVRVDRGAVVRTEFSPAIPVDSLIGETKDGGGFLTEMLTGLQPYIFADYGAGHDIASNETLQRAGIGAGLRYRHGRINLDLSVGEPVYRNGGVNAKDWQSPEAYLSLSVRLL